MKKTYTINIETVTFQRENLADWGNGQIQMSHRAEASVSVKAGKNWLTVGVSMTPVLDLRYFGVLGNFEGDVLYEITEPNWSDSDPDGDELGEQWQYSGDKQKDLLNRILIDGMERIENPALPGVYFGIRK